MDPVGFPHGHSGPPGVEQVKVTGAATTANWSYSCEVSMTTDADSNPVSRVVGSSGGSLTYDPNDHVLVGTQSGWLGMMSDANARTGTYNVRISWAGPYGQTAWKDLATQFEAPQGKFKFICSDADTGVPINPVISVGAYQYLASSGIVPADKWLDVPGRLPNDAGWTVSATLANYRAVTAVLVPAADATTTVRIRMRVNTAPSGSGEGADIDTSAGGGSGSGDGTGSGNVLDAEWWKQLFHDLFVPSDSTLAAWSDFFNRWLHWGPLGWVVSWFDAWKQGTTVPGATQQFGVPTPFGQVLIDCRPRTYAGGVLTGGTGFGDLIANIRFIEKLAVICGMGIALFRWLRPRFQI
jgi:hypothetical protein